MGVWSLQILNLSPWCGSGSMLTFGSCTFAATAPRPPRGQFPSLILSLLSMQNIFFLFQPASSWKSTILWKLAQQWFSSYSLTTGSPIYEELQRPHLRTTRFPASLLKGVAIWQVLANGMWAEALGGTCLLFWRRGWPSSLPFFLLPEQGYKCWSFCSHFEAWGDLETKVMEGEETQEKKTGFLSSGTILIPDFLSLDYLKIFLKSTLLSCNLLKMYPC